ncbi:hypothetical protein J8002_001893 [Salmonella enterica]|nr:hypothetical protein [Salmonella enterica]
MEIRSAEVKKTAGKLTEETALNNISARCSELGFEFLGFVGGSWAGYYTKMILRCTKHDHTWETTSYGNFVKGGKGCVKCRLEKSNKTRGFDPKKYEEKIKQLLVGRDIEFLGWFGGECKNAHNRMILKCTKHNIIWDTTTYTNFIRRPNMMCEECVNEKMANERKMSESVALSRAQDAANALGENYSVVGFDGGYKNNQVKNLIINCSIHGDYKVNLANHLNGKGCRCCAETGYQTNKPGYFYIQKLSGDVDAIKYGITNLTPEERMKQQNRKSVLTHELFFTQRFDDGKAPFEIERIVKRCYRGVAGYVSKEIMEDGYSETLPAHVLPLLIKQVKSLCMKHS